MSSQEIGSEELQHLRELDSHAAPAPWRLMVEGRDHQSGDHFIMVGEGDNRQEDLYLYREKQVASIADYELVAEMRNYIGPLLDEIERLRDELHGGSSRWE